LRGGYTRQYLRRAWAQGVHGSEEVHSRSAKSRNHGPNSPRRGINNKLPFICKEDQQADTQHILGECSANHTHKEQLAHTILKLLNIHKQRSTPVFTHFNWWFTCTESFCLNTGPSFDNWKKTNGDMGLIPTTLENYILNKNEFEILTTVGFVLQ